jgi:UDP-N-acetylglucosamine 2-epimerase (non-hydrolysing)
VWNDLGLPKPDVFLGVGSGTHAEQTAAVMIKFERVCLQEKPDLVIVVGDVNSTMACAIVAKKLAISVAHVEAGLRSSDMGMPEEINRILTDSISDYLFVSEKSGYSNLIKEGKSRKKIHFVGNIMIDSLLSSSRRISKSKILSQLKLFPKQYGLVTLHRPSNVDSFSQLGPLLRELNLAAKLLPLVFPVHPRTRKNIQNLRGCDISTDIALIDPVGYIDFLCLVSNASYVLTDSGGIQEETTFLGVPCLTLRENTERPITIEIGTNKLVSTRSLRGELKVVLSGKWKRGKIPKYWDGNTAHRIISVLSPKS